MREENDPFEIFPDVYSDEEENVEEDYESRYALKLKKRRKAMANRKFLSDEEDSGIESVESRFSESSQRADAFSEAEKKKILSEEKFAEIFGDADDDAEDDEKQKISEKRKKLIKLARLRKQKEKNYEEYFSQEDDEEENRYFDETYAGRSVKPTGDTAEGPSLEELIYYGILPDIPEKADEKKESREKLSSYVTDDLKTLENKHSDGRETVFSEGYREDKDEDSFRSSKVRLKDSEKAVKTFGSEEETSGEGISTDNDKGSIPEEKDRHSKTLSRIRRNALLKEESESADGSEQGSQDYPEHAETVFTEPEKPWKNEANEPEREEKAGQSAWQSESKESFESTGNFSENADSPAHPAHPADEVHRTDESGFSAEEAEGFKSAQWHSDEKSEAANMDQYEPIKSGKALRSEKRRLLSQEYEEGAEKESFVSSSWHKDEDSQSRLSEQSELKEELSHNKSEGFGKADALFSEGDKPKPSKLRYLREAQAERKIRGNSDGSEKNSLNENQESGGTDPENLAERQNKMSLNETSESDGMNFKNSDEWNEQTFPEARPEAENRDGTNPQDDTVKISKVSQGEAQRSFGKDPGDTAETEKFISSRWHSDSEKRSADDASGSLNEAVSQGSVHGGIAESLDGTEEKAEETKHKRRGLISLRKKKSSESKADASEKSADTSESQNSSYKDFVFREDRGEEYTDIPDSYEDNAHPETWSGDPSDPGKEKRNPEHSSAKISKALRETPDDTDEGFHSSWITTERNNNYTTSPFFFSEKSEDGFRNNNTDDNTEMPYKRKRKKGIFLIGKNRNKKFSDSEEETEKETEKENSSIPYSYEEPDTHSKKSGLSKALKGRGIKEDLSHNAGAYTTKTSAFRRKENTSDEGTFSEQTKRSTLKERLIASFSNAKAKESPYRQGSDGSPYTSGKTVFSENRDGESSGERRVSDENRRYVRNFIIHSGRQSEFYNGEEYVSESILSELESSSAKDEFETHTVSSDYEKVQDRKIAGSIFYKEKSDFRKNTEEAEFLSKKDQRDRSLKKAQRDLRRKQRVEKQYAAFRKSEDINIKARNAALEAKRLAEKSASLDDDGSSDSASEEVFNNSAYIAKVMTQKAIQDALDKDSQYSNVSEISKSVTAEEKARESEKKASEMYREQEKRIRAAAYKSAQSAKNTASAAGKAGAEATKEAGTAAAAGAGASHGWIVILVLVVVALFMMICVSCSVIVTAVGGGLVSSSYMADDKDIFEATTYYCEKEAAMKAKINKDIKKAENSFIYDDVRYSVDAFEHDPRVIISYLCARYPGWDFNSSIMEYGESFIKHVFDHDHPGLGVKPILDDLFEAQYEYQETEYIEYYYPHKKSLFPRIIRVKEFMLVNKGLEGILLNELQDEETKEYYNTLNEYRGNRAWFGKVVDYKYDDYLLNLCGNYVKGTIMTSRLRNTGLSNGGGLTLTPSGGSSVQNDLTYNDDGTVSANGTVINLPPGKGQYFTFEGWQKITAKDTLQLKLKEETGMHFDSEGFGIVGNRYAVAVTSKYGSVGDYIDVYQSDGTIFPCIIGDIKAASDPGNDGWGHNFGKVVVEFIVDKNTWYYPMHENPGTPACHPEWGGKNITKIVNLGSYFSGDPAPDAGYMPDGMHEIGYVQTNNLSTDIDKNHWGIDIAGTQSTNVFACFDGTVKSCGSDYIEITDEDETYLVRYDSITPGAFSEDQAIEQGAVLGTMSDNENLGIPHLHLELKYIDDDQYYDSFFYFEYGDGDAPDIDVFSGGGYSATGSFVPGDSELGNRVVQKALTRLGLPYVYGGAHSEAAIHNPDQSVFDCSGLVCWAYCQAGASIGVNDTKALSKLGRQLSFSEMQAGDIILWSSNGAYSGIHHVAIYIGGGKVVEAPKPGDVVCISSVYDKNLIYTIRRLYE